MKHNIGYDVYRSVRTLEKLAQSTEDYVRDLSVTMNMS